MEVKWRQPRMSRKCPVCGYPISGGDDVRVSLTNPGVSIIRDSVSVNGVEICEECVLTVSRRERVLEAIGGNYPRFVDELDAVRDAIMRRNFMAALKKLLSYAIAITVVGGLMLWFFASMC